MKKYLENDEDVEILETWKDLWDICPYKTVSKRKFSNRLVSRVLFQF